MGREQRLDSLLDACATYLRRLDMYFYSSVGILCLIAGIACVLNTPEPWLPAEENARILRLPLPITLSTILLLIIAGILVYGALKRHYGRYFEWALEQTSSGLAQPSLDQLRVPLFWRLTFVTGSNRSNIPAQLVAVGKRYTQACIALRIDPSLRLLDAFALVLEGATLVLLAIMVVLLKSAGVDTIKNQVLLNIVTTLQPYQLPLALGLLLAGLPRQAGRISRCHAGCIAMLANKQALAYIMQQQPDETAEKRI
jgi:hypothetical protein